MGRESASEAGFSRRNILAYLMQMRETWVFQ